MTPKPPKARREFSAPAAALLQLTKSHGRESEGLEEAITAALMVISEFQPQDIAISAWALAKMSLKAPPLQDALADRLFALLEEFRATDLAKMAWAFARQRVDDGPIFDALASCFVASVSSATAAELSSMAWAIAKVLIVHTPLFDAISAAAVARIS